MLSNDNNKTVTILGYKQVIKKSILDMHLLQEFVSNTFTIETEKGPLIDDRLSDHISECLRNGIFISMSPETDIYLYEFIRKYCNSFTVKINLPRIGQLSKLIKKYLNYFTDVHNEPADIFIAECKNVYPDNLCKCSLERQILFDALAYRQIDPVDIFCHVNNINDDEKKLLLHHANLPKVFNPIIDKSEKNYRLFTLLCIFLAIVILLKFRFG